MKIELLNTKVLRERISTEYTVNVNGKEIVVVDHFDSTGLDGESEVIKGDNSLTTEEDEQLWDFISDL